jgi:hypothetical protein
MNSENPPLQMIFSTQNREAEHNALSFYLEDNLWGHLLELVNEYGNFEIYKETADKFLLHLGQHRFSVIKDFNKTSVNMLDVSLMTPGAAELLAKIADLIFFDRKRRFMIMASNTEYEKLAWTACQNLEIALKPADKSQAERFQSWSAAHQIEQQHQFKSFSQNLMNKQIPSNDDPSPGSSSKK